MENKHVQRIRTWLLTGQRAIWLEYACLGLLVLLPLLLPGYILTLDLVFTPNITWPTDLSNTYPLEILLWLLGRILPGDIIEKIVLFSILLLSGVGMHLLIRTLASPRIHTDAWLLAPYIGGIFYMINPFTYSRFMAGQWMFLLGYALLPFFVRSFIRLVREPSLKTGGVAGLWAFAIVTASIHHVGIIALIGGLLGAMALFRYRRFPQRVFAPIAVSIGIFTLLSSSWLLPSLLGTSEVSRSASGFDSTHFEAFSTDGGSMIGQIANVVRLQGFWAESQQLFTLPQAVTPAWGLVFLLLWIVVIIGGVSTWKRHRLAATLATGCIVSAVILSATPIIPWLSTYAPVMAGYREPHKFASLVALGFAILLTYGTARIIANTTRTTTSIAMAIGLLLLPLAITPTMLWGFAGQLSPRQYPAEWYGANEKLKQLTKNHGYVLFLPWHQYASFSFTERIIASPAEKFFEVPVIASDDPEFGGISPTSPNAKRQQIKALLETPSHTTAMQLSKLGISHILLTNEQDQENYQWLDKMPGIRQISKDTKLTLYTVEEKR